MWDGVDRRRFVRAQYPCLIKVHQDKVAPQTILTHTENISIGGVQVIIRVKFEIMTGVDLEIDLMDTLEPMRTKGTIAWVRELPATQSGRPPRYNTGIRFISLRDENKRRIENVIDHIGYTRSKEKGRRAT